MPDTATAPTVVPTIVRPLGVLVPLIADDIKQGRQAAERAAMPFFLSAGEKLLEAKTQLPHGEFQPWVQAHFKISLRTARLYMQIAEAAVQSGNALPFSSLKDFLRHTSAANPTVNDSLWLATKTDHEARRMAAEERDAEHKARRRLGLQLIALGFKELAKTLHPDKGGSREAMVRLNSVHAGLKKAHW